jgi:hypothetical protein
MPPLPATAGARLQSFLAQMEQVAKSFVGYPCSQDLSVRKSPRS